jgi:iron only hydrogenase large subunit-like protein
MDTGVQPRPLITVDEEKCNNCQACVTACPVKICIDASGEKTRVIDELCLGCGKCIANCLQEARSYNDDTSAFFAALNAGEDIVVIVAPAVVTVFDDILRLNGYLKSIGVMAVFDVSFGAELTVYSYLKHAELMRPPIIVAQPCPALVTYCEIYKPELLRHLAPAQSPMLHTAVMIKEFFPKYKNAKIAAISPCAAKTREFAETGLVHFNVTMNRLKERLKAGEIRLQNYERQKFEGPQAERAVLFSTPGGLRDTAAREAPHLIHSIRKVEGPGIVYKYLDELPEMIRGGNAPFIVDCLNCELGCNGGPGTGNFAEPVDKLESVVARRAREQIEKNKKAFPLVKIKRSIKKYWKKDIYKRAYLDLSERLARHKEPKEAQLTAVFESMKKYSEKDMYNCSACGYGSCRAMAVAVFNKINRPENCHHYLKAKGEEDEKLRTGAVRLAETLVEEIEKSRRTLTDLWSKVSNYIERTGELGSSLLSSSSKMEEMISQIKTIAAVAEEKRHGIERLEKQAQATKKDMRAMLVSFFEVEKTTKEIAGIADVIEEISTSTNLLAMNAAIEAAHAGESGKGFAVVAGEIRNLANKTGENANSISANIKKIVKQINASLGLSNKADGLLEEMISSVDVAERSFSEIIETHRVLNRSTEAMTGDLKLMNEKSDQLGVSSSSIIEALDSIKTLIDSLDNAKVISDS